MSSVSESLNSQSPLPNIGEVHSTIGDVSVVTSPKDTTPYLRRADYTYTYCYCEENIYKLLEKLMLMQLLDKAKKDMAGGLHTRDLGEQSVASQFDKMYAVFLSSYDIDPVLEVENKWISHVPIRLSSGDSSDINTILGNDCCICFDYHVIALLRHCNGKDWYVADFDAKFKTYPEEFNNTESLKSLLIPAKEYFSKAFEFKDLTNMRPIPTHWDPMKLQQMFTRVRCRIVPAESLLTYFRSDRSHMKLQETTSEPPYHIIDGPSPVMKRLIDGGIETFRPQFNNLLCSYININININTVQNAEKYLGEVIRPCALREWMAQHSTT